jgi:hypothetical protein
MLPSSGSTKSSTRSFDRSAVDVDHAVDHLNTIARQPTESPGEGFTISSEASVMESPLTHRDRRRRVDISPLFCPKLVSFRKSAVSLPSEPETYHIAALGAVLCIAAKMGG